MITVAQLFRLLDRARVLRETGFGQQVLSRAVVANVMPSGWYFAIRALCVESGIECPDYLFRWTPTKRQTSVRARHRDLTVAA